MPTLLSLEALEMDRIYVQRQLAEVNDTPWGTAHIMWRNRLAEIEQKIAEAGLTRSNFASVAIIFDGDPVIGSSDIQLDFTADALDRYQRSSR